MKTENPVQPDEKDLFGAPVSQIRERWGRASFTKTKENQELVALLRAADWSHVRIARYLGCDEKTLRKHFSRELDAGADLIEGMALQVTLKKMREGHAPAINRILAIVEKGQAAPPAPAQPKAPEPKLGKKEQAQADFENAQKGSSWGQLLQ